MSKKNFEITIVDHAPIHLSDGCMLSARIWKPETKDALPAILEIHPYPKRYATAERDEFNHGWFARHGYVSMRVDTRGIGDSEGHIYDEYREQELVDLEEVIRWIVAQEWCDGQVGMFGHSWGAYVSLLATARNIDSLKAVAVSGASDDLYAEDCHFRGGVMTTEHMGWASTMMSFFSRPPDPQISGKGWKKKWIRRLEEIPWTMPKWLGHPTRDDHWKEGSLCEDYAGISTPILAASGWHDVYCNSVLRMAEKIPSTFCGVIGPWAHKFPHMGMPRPAIGWLDECVKWWDFWLKGIDNGAGNRPRLRAYLSENADTDPHSLNERRGRWVARKDWPTMEGETTSYFLRPGQLGNEPGESILTVCSPQSLGIASGELMPMGWGADLPGDQRRDDALSLCFDSEELLQPTAILGHPELELKIRSDRPVASLFARLCDVAPDGSSTRVCYGALNLTHSEDHTSINPLKPGEFVNVKLVLDGAGYQFLKGHRLRLTLSTAYWPLFWPAPETVTIDLDPGDCRFRLPLFTGTNAEAPVFSSAEKAFSEPRTTLQKARSRRTVEHDIASGDALYTVADHGARERIDQHGMETWNKTTRKYFINDSSPDTCRMTSKRNLFVRRGKLRLRTETTAKMTCDKENFHLSARLRAWKGKKKVFDRKWSDVVPRNGN